MYTHRGTDRIWDVFAWGNAVETGITVNVGVYQWSAEDGIGTVVDADFFASALTIGSTAVAAKTETKSIFDQRAVGTITHGETLSTLISDTGSDLYAVVFGISGAVDQAAFLLGGYSVYTAGD